MLKPFMKQHGWKYIPGAILLVVCSFLNTRSPLILGEAINMLEAGDWALFSRCVWMMILIALGVFATRNGWRYFIIGNSRNLEVALRDQLYAHLQRLPMDFFGRNRTGDMMAYAINDVNAVRMTCGPGLAQVLNGLSALVFSISAMAISVHPRLTLFALLPVPLAIVIVLALGKSIQLKFKRVQELFTNISGHVQENIMGMRVIKAFAQEKPQLADFTAESNELSDANVRLANTSASIGPAIDVAFGISFVIGLIYGGGLVLEGGITLGDYVAFNTLLTQIRMPVVMLGRIVNMLQRGMASYKRLNAIMSEPEIPEFERIDDHQPISGAIRAENLSFRYPGAPDKALRSISFDIQAGQVLGVVGPTGSGKSTLMNMITKLNSPGRGQLFVDGRDICDIPAISIRNQSGYVPQDGFLFNQTIRENILFFSGTDQAALSAAIHASGLSADIAKMHDGLETMCGERGNHLSGGQRQRTALARALVRNPRILLLDDTLSAVDGSTERFILDQLDSVFSGKTVMIIAHRLSAVRHADEILYLEHGEVAERGTHDQLIALGGKYAAMWNEQQQEASAQ